MALLLAFFALTFLVTWACWMAVAAASGGTLSPAGGLPLFGRVLFLLGVFAPALVALVLTARTDGRAGTSVLLNRVLRWQVDVRWYVFAIGYFAVIKLSAAVLHRIITGGWPAFGATPLFIMAAAIIISTPFQAGEEIGWRGYALPRLAQHLGPGPAGVLLGIIWACWHLPVFFIPGSETSGQPFPVYLLGVTALSVAMAWLYLRTDGSLLLTMLMHAAINNTRDIVPSTPSPANNPFALNASLVAWISHALFWLCAVYFLIRMRRAKLQGDPEPASVST